MVNYSCSLTALLKDIVLTNTGNRTPNTGLLIPTFNLVGKERKQYGKESEKGKEVM